MKWIVVAVIAEVLVAYAIALAVSYMTSTETCAYDYPQTLTHPFSTDPAPEPVLPVDSTTCSRHFWWQ